MEKIRIFTKKKIVILYFSYNLFTLKVKNYILFK